MSCCGCGKHKTNNSLNACNCAKERHFIHKKCLNHLIVQSVTTICRSVDENYIQTHEYRNQKKSFYSYLWEQNIFWSIVNLVLLVLNLIWTLRQLFCLQYKELLRSGDNQQVIQNLILPMITVFSTLFAFRRLYCDFIDWRNICLVIHLKSKGKV